MEPFSSCRLSLKKADLLSASEPARAVFLSALGTYWLSDDPQEVERELTRLDTMYGGHGNSLYAGSDARRFAGDATLSRARYASVVTTDLESDRVLLREFSAYLLGSTYPGLVSLFDSGVMNSMELLSVLGEISPRNERDLDLSVPALLIAVRPLAEDEVLAGAYGAAPHYVVQIPYQVTESMASDVLDLRRPEARDWLVDRYNGRVALPRRRLSLKAQTYPFLLHRPPLEDFSQLLPSLLTQWLGGGWATGNATGLFARWAGARALVYPSARDDPWVSVEDGEVRDSSSWCMVSYAGSPLPDTVGAVSHASAPWPTEVGWEPLQFTKIDTLIPLQGTSIDYTHEGPHKGTFAVSGVRAQNRAAYRLSQVCTLARAVHADAGVALSRLMSTAALSSTAEDTAWMAGVILRALVGDAAALNELVPRAQSELTRELVSRAREVVRRVPVAFRAPGTYRDSLPLWT